MPTDMEGTPFVFAAWITGRRGNTLVGRVIDKDPFETVSAYGMEDAEIALPGAPDLAAGAVILSDRATVCTVFGQEGFHIEGGSWTIGFAKSEDEALYLVGSSVRPGAWPDLRNALPSQAEMDAQEAQDIAADSRRAMNS